VDRHPFDPISLVFGVLFATTGLMVLLGWSLVDEGAFLAPVALIALGFALLYQARRRREPPDPSA
jgi:membrane protein implicated in regulation of membrane protease activity